jgi:integrase
LTIGRHGSPWSPETARLEARRHLYGLVHGSKCDPAGLRDSLNSEPTLAIFAGRYLAEYAAIRKKPRSVREDRRNLALHILPSLGSFKLSEIGRGDVIRLHAAQHARPVNANRCLSLISHIFTVAEKWDLSPPNSNPCRGIERYREISRERFLTTAELRRLGAALESASRGYQDAAWEEFAPSQRLMRTGPEDWRAVACYRLLLFTGARLSEILSLRWSWIDRERGLARLPDSKTGAKTLTLPQPALACLKQIKERVQERYPGTPFVLPGDRSGGHFKGIQAPWQRIRLLAGLADVRIHDLSVRPVSS